MNEKGLWLLLAVFAVIAMMAIAVAVSVVWNRRQEDKLVASGPLWRIELWNIGHGYQVGYCFENTCILGRLSLCQNVIGDIPPVMEETVSREHCMLIDQNGVLLVWNMSSVNPTRLNGYQLNGPAPIMPGDRIELGDSAYLVTRVECG